MDYGYSKEIYSEIITDLFLGCFVINATINILGKEIIGDSIYDGMGDYLDGRQVDPVQVSFPLDIPKFIRVKIYPIEKQYSKYATPGIQYSIGVPYEPFDRWVSCFESAIAIQNNQTYLDYADNVEIDGIVYRIKGKIKETFGLKPIIHIFLTKATNE